MFFKVVRMKYMNVLKFLKTEETDSGCMARYSQKVNPD